MPVTILRHLLKLATTAAVSTVMLGSVYHPWATGEHIRALPYISTLALASSGSWAVQALDFVSANEGWVLADNQQGNEALFRTQDRGQQWTIIHPDWRPLGNRNTTMPLTIAFANQRDGWMVLGERGGSKGTLLGLSQGYAEVARTTDGGRQWHLKARKLVFGDGPVSLTTTSSSSVWLSTGNVMAGQNGVWHTTDGGTRWMHSIVRSPIPAYGSNVSGLYASSPSQAVLPTGMQLPHHRVLVLDQWTTDGGRRWHTVRLPPTGLPVGTMLPINPSFRMSTFPKSAIFLK